METNLIYFKCPNCDEMSRVTRINKYMKGIGVRFMEVDCDVCHDTIRLRFTVTIGNDIEKE
jgi:hypothetical protein